MLNVKFEMLI